MTLQHLAFLSIASVLASSAIGTAVGYAPGDIYTGELLSGDAKDPHGIVLNMTPCDPKESRVSLKEGTFRLEDLGEETCPGPHGRKYRKVQAEELPSPPPAHQKDPPKPNPK